MNVRRLLAHGIYEAFAMKQDWQQIRASNFFVTPILETAMPRYQVPWE